MTKSVTPAKAAQVIEALDALETNLRKQAKTVAELREQMEVTVAANVPRERIVGLGWDQKDYEVLVRKLDFLRMVHHRSRNASALPWWAEYVRPHIRARDVREADRRAMWTRCKLDDGTVIVFAFPVRRAC